MSRRDPATNASHEIPAPVLQYAPGEIPPLERVIHVNINTNLADLMLNPRKAGWHPSEAVISTILQKEQFTDLNGTKKPCGDLRSVVLHHVKLTNACSNIPVAVGLRMTGIEEKVFSPTAQKFAAILPENAINQSRVLDHSDKSSTHTFASKFPGYTATNLSQRNVHKVPSQGVVFAAADHPMIQAIQENKECLQMGHFAPLEGQGSQGLYSIGEDMWNHVLPHVLDQVESQVRTCDMTGLNVQITPADHSSWTQVRQQVLATETAALKTAFERKIGLAESAPERDGLRAEMTTALKDYESSIDLQKMTVSGDLELQYKFIADSPESQS
jgi:hypothetical protein